MKNILILGAGKIGSLIALLFAQYDDYQVNVGDINFDQPDNARLKNNPRIHCHLLDVSKKIALVNFLKIHHIDATISSLPFYCNTYVIEAAYQHQCHYFDLTENVHITEEIRKISKNSLHAFVPQCGLAPGIVGIIAHSLMKEFDELDTVKLRVGALPARPTNVLKYSLTWSTDGLINEYSNLCHAIKNGEIVEIQPLEGLENLSIDGLNYECFNTSGGLGDLTKMYQGKVKDLTYKTIHYPGHCDIMRLLMIDLKLQQNQLLLKKILENSIPRSLQDVVIIFVSVVGKKQWQPLGVVGIISAFNFPVAVWA